MLKKLQRSIATLVSSDLQPKPVDVDFDRARANWTILNNVLADVKKQLLEYQQSMRGLCDSSYAAVESLALLYPQPTMNLPSSEGGGVGTPGACALPTSHSAAVHPYCALAHSAKHTLHALHTERLETCARRLNATCLANCTELLEKFAALRTRILARDEEVEELHHYNNKCHAMRREQSKLLTQGRRETPKDEERRMRNEENYARMKLSYDVSSRQLTQELASYWDRRLDLLAPIMSSFFAVTGGFAEQLGEASRDIARERERAAVPPIDFASVLYEVVSPALSATTAAMSNGNGSGSGTAAASTTTKPRANSISSNSSQSSQSHSHSQSHSLASYSSSSATGPTPPPPPPPVPTQHQQQNNGAVAASMPAFTSVTPPTGGASTPAPVASATPPPPTGAVATPTTANVAAVAAASGTGDGTGAPPAAASPGPTASAAPNAVSTTPPVPARRPMIPPRKGVPTMTAPLSSATPPLPPHATTSATLPLHSATPPLQPGPSPPPPPPPVPSAAALAAASSAAAASTATASAATCVPASATHSSAPPPIPSHLSTSAPSAASSASSTPTPPAGSSPVHGAGSSSGGGGGGGSSAQAGPLSQAGPPRAGPPPHPEPFGKGLAFADMHRRVGAEIQQWTEAHTANNVNTNGQ